MQDVGSGRTDERPVRLGGALVTIVDPHKGHEVAYNRWYERDHFYAGCMIGNWNISGARFVATRDLKALRYPADSPIIPDPEAGSYLSVYWILAGKFGEWMQWATAQVKWLHENGRMFDERDHVHTLMYSFRTHYERADGVPVELALDHRSPYLVLVMGRPSPTTSLDQIDAWFADNEPLGVVGAELTPLPLPDNVAKGVRAKSESDHFCQLWFVDDEITDVWDDRFAGLGDAFSADGLGELTLVAPFRATIPGTDTYTDQLW